MMSHETDLFHLSHLNLRPTDHTAGQALIAVMKTEEFSSNAYFLLCSTYSNSHVQMIQVKDIEEAKQVLQKTLSNLNDYSDLQLSHLVCQGIVMGHLSTNGRLWARTGEDDRISVPVQSFDEMRSYHLSPVLEQNVFQILHDKIRQQPSLCVQAFAKAGESLHMRGWDFESQYAKVMSGLMLPDEVKNESLIQSCRQATLAITEQDPAARQVLWAQLNKVENTNRPLPESPSPILQASHESIAPQSIPNEIPQHRPKF